MAGRLSVGGATRDLVEAGDVDGLLRRIDDLVDDRAWQRLADLCRSCRAAVERGKQLWPVALHGEYRLALSAPAEFAAPAAAESAMFSLGPLTEVVAMHHTWADLSPHFPPGPSRCLAAHERVVRGEAVDPADIDQSVLDTPTRLERWEPDYATAEYEAHRASFPAPTLPPADGSLTGGALSPVPDPGVEALLTLTAHWSTGSSGRSEAVMVEGTAGDAVATLGLASVAAARLDVGQAVAQMAWAAASGGAHGRRRGMAAGRFDAWWAMAILAGIDTEWPPAGDDLGEAAAELDWYLWRPALPETGWALHLAVEDPNDGLAWAISAVDAG